VLRGTSRDEESIGNRDLTRWPSRGGKALVALALRLARWGAANTVLVATALVGGVAAVALTAASAEVYDNVVDADGLAALDEPVLNQAVAWRSPPLDHAVTWYTNLGGVVGLTILATLAVLLMVARWRSRTPLVLMLIAVTGSLAMTVAGKDLTGRARPPTSLAVPPFETSPSFPSGHTLNSTVIAGLVVYLVLRRLRRVGAGIVVVAAGAAFAVAMGLSRVFLGHHWLTDVIAAWALGLGWLVVVVTAHRLYLTVRRARGEGTGGDVSRG
jgi:membrane-associated phospholipid phosphatase